MGSSNRTIIWSILVPLVCCSVSLAQEADKADDGAKAAAKSRVGVVIPIHGPITPFTGAFVDRKLEDAKAMGAKVVIIEINSPGGYADVSFSIANKLQDLDWAEVIAYVEHEAISGAAIIALGCHKVVMKTGAKMGDAGVITQDLIKGGPFQYAPEKVLSKYVADIRELAKSSGRPEALAEAMMDKDAQVFEATNNEDESTWFFTKAEWDSLKDADQWTRGKPIFEARENTFLTTTGDRAVELKLADATAESQADLCAQFNVKDDPQVLNQTGVDTTVWILNLPLVTFLLFVIGLLALFVEFSAPGLGMGGLTSALCFGLFFWSRFLGGTAGWLELTLFIMGLVFIACEIFVIPGFGVPGISGFLLVLGSLIMASRHVVIPETGTDLANLNSTLATLGASVIAFILLAVFGGKYLLDVPIVNRFMLVPQASDGAGVVSPVGSGVGEALQQPAPWDIVNVGDEGSATSPLRPAGKVEFGDVIVDVVTEGDFVESGSAVRIVQKQGTRVVVRAV